MGAEADLGQNGLGQVGPRRVHIPDGCGCIYVVKWGPYYKIGKTVDPERPHHVAKSISRIEPKSPFRAIIFSIFFCWKNDLDRIERALHQKFSKLRKNGEWFELGSIDHCELHEQCELPYWEAACMCWDKPMRFDCEKCSYMNYFFLYEEYGCIPCPS